MHNWRYAAALVFTAAISTPTAMAANWMCGQDLNNNGNTADPGETKACVTIGSQKFCPLATDCSTVTDETCTTKDTSFRVNIAAQGRWRLDISFDLKNGTWWKNANTDGSNVQATVPRYSKDELCRDGNDVTFASSSHWSGASGMFGELDTSVKHRVIQAPSCSNDLIGRVYIEDTVTSTGDNYWWLGGAFNFNAKQTSCIDNTSYACPLGDQYACLNNNGNYQCSQNSCVNLDVDQPVVTNEITGEMLVDDGRRDSEGLCMDQLMIFSGKANECKTAGTSTAFQNCCDSGDDKILTDDMGSIASLVGSYDTIKTVYTIAEGAYYGYQASLALGSTAAEASAVAANTVTNGTLIAFDPTTLAISIAVYFIMEYLTKACDAESMDTAMMAGSGYCREVGEYCKEDWPLVGCVQEAKSYCCFNSKMARIIHEQGRPQLTTFGANSWGNVESPNCRGFSPDEFQSLDFSKIDLTEYYSDLTSQTEAVIQNQINEGVNEFYNHTR